MEWTGDKKLGTITPADAQDFALWLRQRPKRNGNVPTESHVRAVLARAKQVCQWCIRGGRLAVNPFSGVKVSQPKVHQDWQYVSLEDLARIKAACPDRHWQTVFDLARLAGLRANEIGGLTWSCVDLSGRALTIRPSGGKETTKKRYRRVPIVAELAASLAAAFPLATGANVVEGVRFEGATTTARRIVTRAGLNYAKPLHTLRKSRETDWLSKYPLPDVAEFMGHSATVALEHYFKSQKSTFSQVTGVETGSQLQNNLQIGSQKA